MPGEQVQPELVLEAGALGEVGEVLADGAENAARSEVSPYDLMAMPEGTVQPNSVRRCTVTSALSQSSSKVLDSLHRAGRRKDARSEKDGNPTRGFATRADKSRR